MLIKYIKNEFLILPLKVLRQVQSAECIEGGTYFFLTCGIDVKRAFNYATPKTTSQFLLPVQLQR